MPSHLAGLRPAFCPDEILTSARPIADFWARIGQRQPSSRMYRRWPMRRFTDWYYMRLLITVTPEAVRSRPPLDATTPLPASGPVPRLAQFTSAVLAGYDTAGRPYGGAAWTGPACPGRSIRT